MKRRKLHLLFLAAFLLLALGTFFYVSSQGSTLARHFFSEDLTVASVPGDDSTEKLGDMIGKEILDSVYGAEGAEIVSTQFTYSPETREISYEVTADKECAARFIFGFHNVVRDNPDSVEPRRREDRVLNVSDCRFDGNRIICETLAPDWATGVDGIILLTER